MRRHILFYAGLITTLLICGCQEETDTTVKSNNNSNTGSTSGNHNQSSSKYNDMNNWIVFDSGKGGKEADIFVIYQSYSDCGHSDCAPYKSLECADMRNRGKSTIDGLASLTTAHTNVYAPYYRQWNFSKRATHGGQIDGIGYDDIAEAFTHYYETVNKGKRPFFILGFSQGGSLAIQLCTKLFAEKQHYNNAHAFTYAAGMSASQADLNKNPRLKVSNSPTDIGAIALWSPIAPSEVTHVENAAATGWQVPYNTLVRNSPSVNPLTWDTSTTAVRKTGSLTVGAQNRTVGPGNFGILVILDYEAEGATSSSGGNGKYHNYALSWFREPIRDNIPVRINAWKAANR